MIVLQGQAATPMDEIQGRLFAVLGGEDPRELIPLVESQLTVTARELAAVPQRAGDRGPDFLAKAAVPMQALMDQLTGYQSWLQQVKASLQSRDHNALVSAHEQAQSLIPALTAALAEYTRFFSSFGPYSTPWPNSLQRLADTIAEGHAEDEAWDEAIAQFEAAFLGKGHEVMGSGLPGRTLTNQAYGRAVRALQALSEVDSFDPESLKPALSELDSAMEMGIRLEGLIGQGLQGEAALPGTNVLISVVRQGLAQRLDPATVSSFIQDYRDGLDAFWENFERNLARPSDSALVKDEIPRTLGYGDAHDAAVEALGDAFRMGDKEGAERALAELVRTAAQLDESREVYATAAQHQTHVMCVDCGRANPPENRRCEACGGVLPVPDGGVGLVSSTFNVLTGPALEETQEMPMTENVARLFQACDEVAAGRMTAEQFQGELNTATAGLKEFAKELSEIAEETSDESNMTAEQAAAWREHHLPYLQELAASFAEGFQVAEEGLKSMALFLKDPDPEHLVQGVGMVWEGLSIIHRAQLSMNANLKLLQDVLSNGPDEE